MQVKVKDISKWYRMISFIISLLIYMRFIFTKERSVHTEVLIGMTISCALLLWLEDNLESSKVLKYAVILIELVWNSFFLLVSGGFSSPFIWYCMSSIVIIGIILPVWYFWISSGCYLLAAILGSNYSIQMNEPGTGERYFYLLIGCGFVLLTFVVFALATYIRILERNRKRLSFLLTINNSKQVIEDFLYYLKDLLGVNQYLLLQLHPKDEIKNYFCSNIETQIRDEIINMVYQYDWNAKQRKRCEYITLNGACFCISFFMYQTGHFGVLAVPVRYKFSYHKKQCLMDNIALLGSLLKKMDDEALEEHLMISEEKNRIADEIHDTILQKLFAISCSAHTLAQKVKEEEIRGDLQYLKEALDNTMKELRNTIYEDVKIEKVFLEEKIEAYIHEMEKLHQMKILFFYNKSMSNLSEIQKNSFYRVICEAVNNAIRHGKANTVIIIIKLQDGELVANIVDDGSGIDRLEEIEMGHGIRNMQNVIRRMRGKIDFKKNKEGGTSVSFAVPLY